MVVVRFGTPAVRNACCDLTHMRRRWGPDLARRVSQRVQQLEAMVAVEDLAFLPFDSRDHDDGTIEVAVSDHLALYLRRAADSSEGTTSVTEIVIVSVRDRQTKAWTS